ncbi:hypothetical protein [Moorena producens]|nr:hypothetical protein [Moorena producens]
MNFELPLGVRRGNYYNVSIITLNTNLPYSLLPTPYSLILELL